MASSSTSVEPPDPDSCRHFVKGWLWTNGEEWNFYRDNFVNVIFQNGKLQDMLSADEIYHLNCTLASLVGLVLHFLLNQLLHMQQTFSKWCRCDKVTASCCAKLGVFLFQKKSACNRDPSKKCPFLGIGDSNLFHSMLSHFFWKTSHGMDPLESLHCSNQIVGDVKATTSWRFFGLNPFTLRSLFWSFPWSLVCSFRSTLVLHDWWWKFTVPACRVNGGWWRFVVYCSQIFGSPLCPLPFLDLWMYVASTFEVVLWSFGNPLLVPTGHITHEHQTYRFKHRGEKSPPKQHWFISWAACMWLAKSMPVWSLKIFRVRVVI